MGGIIGGGGKQSGTSTTTSTARALEPEEKRLLTAEAEIQELQVKFLPEQQEAERTFFEFIETQQAVQAERFAQEKKLREEVFPEEFATLESRLLGGEADELALVDKLAGEQFELGKSRLLQSQEDSLEQLRDVLTPSRGLRPNDTPIQDIGGRIARETQREVGTLDRAIGAASTEFKLGLKQRAQENALRLASFKTGSLLALQGQAPAVQPASLPPIPFQSSNSLAALANRGGTTTTNTTSRGGGSGFGSFLSGVGSILTGVGAFGPFGAAAGAGSGVGSLGTLSAGI